jgi:hypothetical protein
MGKWLVWITMLVIAVLLICAGIQGRLGSVFAAIFTPSALGDTNTLNSEEGGSASSGGIIA